MSGFPLFDAFLIVILEIGKKKFSTSSMACGNFWQKTESAFLVYFQSLILGAPFNRSLPFFQLVLFMGSLIHIQNFRQKMESQENGQDRVQNISVCKVWKVNFI